MPDKLRTIEDAVDAALRILDARFDEPDQQAAVQLGLALYSLQSREEFDARKRAGEIPYEA